jgi:hypothetical protein
MATEYTRNIVDVNFKNDSIKNNMVNITEYDNALKGKLSTLLKTANPGLGKIYFQSTGEPCKKDTDRYKKYIASMKSISVSPSTAISDTSLPFTTYSNYFNSNEGNPTRFIFIDTYKNRDLSDPSFYNSAATDLASQKDPNVEASKIEQNSCVPVTVQVMDADGSRKYETQFVTVADVDKIASDLYITDDDDGNPMKPVQDSKEGFTMDTNQIFDKMDAGQKIFVGSVGILSLYFVFKLLYKPLHGR